MQVLLLDVILQTAEELLDDKRGFCVLQLRRRLHEPEPV